jgi:hypothetical protein
MLPDAVFLDPRPLTKKASTSRSTSLPAMIIGAMLASRPTRTDA